MDSFSTTALSAALPAVQLPQPPPAQADELLHTPQAPAEQSSTHSQTSADRLQPLRAANRSSASYSHDDRSIGSQQSREEVWFLKEVSFFTHGEWRQYKVITQNFNGPCSLIAICNILILRDQMQIEPAGRTSVSYDYLSTLLASHLLATSPSVDISAALSIMPHTTRGMDLNPCFTGATSFRPSSLTGGELDLFSSAGIALVHGWLVDPDSPEYGAVERAGSYDAAANLIVEADVLTKGRLVQAQDEIAAAGEASGSSSAGASGSGSVSGSATMALSTEQRRKVEDAIILQAFLDNTRSQLTYHGLFTLASLNLPAPPSADDPDTPQLFALFRNAHLSVLYKHPSGALYTLATDEAFLREPSVVWERLEDVDQGASVFVDARFERSAPAGGDWAGWTPEADADGRAIVDPADHALAKQLQQEEDRQAQEAYARRQEQERQQQRGAGETARAEAQDEKHRIKRDKKKKKGDCVIM